MTQPSHDTVATHPPRLYLLPSLERRRRTLSPRIGYSVAALVVGLGLFASVTPSPLYRTYSVLWHFSSPTLTLIYATSVLAGIVVAHVALPTTFEIFGSVVAAIALTVAFEAWRTRPTPQLAA